MYYSKPGYIDVVFSGLTNKPDPDGKWHIITCKDKIIVPEAIEYRFVFSMFGVGAAEIDYCCRSAMKKLDAYIQGRDWYSVLGYEPLMKITPDMRNHMKTIAGDLRNNYFGFYFATHFSYGPIQDDKGAYRFEGILMMDGTQHFMYSKK